MSSGAAYSGGKGQAPGDMVWIPGGEFRLGSEERATATRYRIFQEKEASKSGKNVNYASVGL